MKRSLTIGVVLLALSPLASPRAHAQRRMERLNRGVVALRTLDGSISISWRLLGTDPESITFNVYRSVDTKSAVRINDAPLQTSTFFTDVRPPSGHTLTYHVRPVVDGQEEAPSKPYPLKVDTPPLPYLEIPIKTPRDYQPNDCSVGDLDGDGDYELVVHMIGRSRDNSQPGFTDPPILHAYRMDGSRLWEINLGKNIREGAHYTQFIVYDLDGDGRAEVACKTAEGTIDGKGSVIGDPRANHVGDDGRVLSGPEYLTIFEGRSGQSLATVDYIPSRGNVGGWGGVGGNGGNDHQGNRCDRFLACAAYLDGRLPSLLMCRGYYGRSVLAAWDWRDGRLTSRWVFDTERGYPQFAGQGNHNLSVADVDQDGKDEIIYGSMVVDDDGRGLFSTGLRHGDALHVADIDPTRPGLEVYGVHEIEGASATGPGTALYDARTGEILWNTANGIDVGRGVTADIDPAHPGMECWGGPGGLRNCRGISIGSSPRSANFVIWWDGDLLRELLDGTRIFKWEPRGHKTSTLLTATGCASNNGTKSTPCLSLDLLGDWREEVIFRTNDNQSLRIYTTTIPTNHRFTTLMHDSQYRLSIAWQNVGYNQPPHPSYFLGTGMAPPPRPKLVVHTRMADAPAQKKRVSSLDRMTTAHLKATHEAVNALRTSRRNLPPLPALKDFRAIFHAHAEDSAHTGGTRPEMLAEARKAGVQVIFLSDHHRPPRDFVTQSWRGIHEGVLFLPGSEERGFLLAPTHSIMTHMNDPLPMFIPEVRENGGLIFLSHVEERVDHSMENLDGMEIYNRHYDAKKDKAGILAVLLKLTDPKQLEEFQENLRLYPQELFAFNVEHQDDYLAKWDSETIHHRLTGIAANDCHHNQVLLVKMVDETTVKVGTNVDSDEQMQTFRALLRPGIRAMTRGHQPGDVLARVDFDPYHRSFRDVSTHILATDLTEEAIRSAVRKGHAYVSHDWMCDPTGFRFQRVGPNSTGIMGDESRFQDGERLIAEFPVACRIRLLDRGKLVREVEGDRLEHPISAPGVYRVEGWLEMAEEVRPWIYSNPIYIRE